MTDRRGGHHAGHRSRPTASPSATSPRATPTRRSPSACTGSPTRRGRGGICCPPWRRRATGRWPPGCGGTPRRPYPPTATTRQAMLGLDAVRPARGARRRRRRRAHRARLGRPRRLRRGRTHPDASWRRLVTLAVPPPAAADQRLLLLRPAPAVLVHVLLPVAAGRHGGADGRPGVHRPAVGRLVARLRRRPRTCPTSRTRCATRPTWPPPSATTGRRSAASASTDDPEVVALQTPRRPAPRRCPRCTCTARRRLHGCRPGAGRRATSSPTPGSRVEIVDGAGHFLHLERPDEVNRLVLDFLAG